jgi:hypothetical protein
MFLNLKICFRRPFGDMTKVHGDGKEKHAMSFGKKESKPTVYNSFY